MGRLALLSAASLALGPRAARAESGPAALAPRFVARVREGALVVSLTVRNTGASPVDLRYVLGGDASVRVKASLEPAGGSAEAPRALGLPVATNAHTMRTRAGPRWTWVPLAPDAEAELGAVSIPIPAGWSVDAGARFTLEAWVGTAEGDVALKAEGVTSTAATEG